RPAGYHDVFFVIDCVGQGRHHGSVAAAAQVQVELVGIHDFFGQAHQAGAGINADNLAVERVRVVIEFRDAVHIGIGRNHQAQLGAVQVGAQILHLIAHTLQILGVSSRQPGGDNGVGIASGNGLPHGSGGKRGHVDLKACLLKSGTQHVGGRSEERRVGKDGGEGGSEI